jgi:hypothetical protein
MCVNEMYSKVHIGKHLSDSFPMQNSLKQGDALSLLLFNFALEFFDFITMIINGVVS